MLPFLLPCLLFALVTGLAVHPNQQQPEHEIAARQQISKEPVSPDVYEKLFYYIRFPKSSKYYCDNPPDGFILQQYFNNTDTDTQAALWRVDSRQELVLAFPGTRGKRDRFTDIDFTPVPFREPTGACKNCLAHHGFLKAWDSINDEVVEALHSALVSYPSYNLIIAGKSLGGGLATVAYASLSSQALDIAQAFAYGAPRAGNGNFAAYIDSLSGASDQEPGTFYRITHENDGVPRMPPRAAGFTHPRTEYWESAHNATLGTTYRCFGSEPRDCTNSQDPVLIVREGGPHTTYAGEMSMCDWD